MNDREFEKDDQMPNPKQLTEEEYYEAIHSIAKPTFNFMMKRINKEILNGKKYQSLDVNDFFNVLLSSMSSVDSNMVRWMQNFYKIKTNQQLDQNKLVMTLISNIDKSLKTILQ